MVKGEGDHHKVNISCLMYHQLITFFTGEKTCMVKRTHGPPHVYLFMLFAPTFGEVDLFRDIGFDGCSYLLDITVPCRANIDCTKVL